MFLITYTELLENRAAESASYLLTSTECWLDLYLVVSWQILLALSLIKNLSEHPSLAEDHRMYAVDNLVYGHETLR